MKTLPWKIVNICALLLCRCLLASGQADFVPELYSGYFPDLQENIIKKISIALPAKCIEIKKLNGLSNNNFLIVCENGQKFVIKVPSENKAFGISYELQEINQNRAHRIGLAPRMQLLEKGLVITDFIQPIKTFVMQKDSLVELALVLARLHYSSLVFENRYDFGAILKNYLELCEKKQCLSKQEKKLTAVLARKYERLSKALRDKSVPMKACHNDLHPGNILISEAGMQLIDWEDSALNDPAWDIAHFLLVGFVPRDLWPEFFSHYLPLIPYDDPSFVDRVMLYRPFILIEVVLSLKTRLDSEKINLEKSESLISKCIEGIQTILNSEKYQRDFNVFLYPIHCLNSLK